MGQVPLIFDFQTPNPIFHKCSEGRWHLPLTSGVSAVLRTALTAELSVPCGSARPICFPRKNAEPRRALTRTALTNKD